MELVTDDAVESWCLRRGVEKRAHGIVFPQNECDWIVIEMPKAARELLRLAADILSLGGYAENASELIWISIWRIWSDWADDVGESIVERLRAHGNAVHSLKEASGQELGFFGAYSRVCSALANHAI